ncbi:MAG: secondary thiamine-phosphate synthase enzyme YjbQ [Candidatus Methanomethyliaceae archaeon]
MKVFLKRQSIQTRKDKELIDITGYVEAVVKESGVKNGFVLVLTMHTSSGIIVTEGLPCLEKDILNCFARLAPANGEYYHNRFLDIDGRLGFNADAHLKSVLGGIHAVFPIQDGRIVKGSRQRVYFAEYDGPLDREYCVQVVGE